MKALLKSSLVIAAAAVAFSSCQTEELTAPVEGQSVSFLAVSSDAKAAFGTPDGNTYPVLWTSNDTKVKVSLNLDQGQDANIAPSEDFTTAVVSSALKDDESGNYIFYAVSPKSASLSFNASYKSVGVEIPSNQTPSATSPDEAAMVLLGQTAALTAFPNEGECVEMPFKHVTAYGLLSFENLNLDGAVISSVEISSDEYLTGRWYTYPEKDSLSVNSGVKSVVISTSASENIWFAVAPVDITGKSVKFIVNTDKGTFTREIEAMTKGNFESGKIAKFAIDMNGIAPVKSDITYKMIKSASELKAGDKVIIGTLTGDFAISSTQNANNRASEAITSEEGVISTIGSSVEIFEVEAGATEGTFAFKATKTAGYIYAAGGTGSSNYMKTSSTKDLVSSWTVAIAEDGNATIKCADTSVARNTLMKNKTNALFSCYASGQNPVAIFKSSEGEPEPDEPVSITIDGEFADWNNSSIATLTLQEGAALKALKTVKYAADASYLYVYMHLADIKANNNAGDDNVMMDFYIDCDGDPATGGLRSDVYNHGINWYFETFFGDPNQGGFGKWDNGQYDFTGSDGASIWGNLTMYSNPDVVTRAGVYDESTDSMTLEARLDRTFFKLVNTKAAFGMVVMEGSSSGWPAMGKLPQNDDLSMFVMDIPAYEAPAPAEPVLITLSADNISTNDPMQYVVGGSDTYGFASNPDWFADITPEQSSAREAKFGLASNLFDDDPATCFHTNLDWGQPVTSWGQRSYSINANREEKRYIQVSLPEAVNAAKIWFQNSDQGHLAESYILAASTDGATFEDYGEAFGPGNFGDEFNVEINKEGLKAFRIVNTREDADWTYVVSAFGIAELKVWDNE